MEEQRTTTMMKTENIWKAARSSLGSSLRCFDTSRRWYESHRSIISPPLEEKPNYLLDQLNQKVKVAVIGGGNWGSAVARKVGFVLSQLDNPTVDTNVKMWIYEEIVNGQKLSEIINSKRENVKYLPGIYIPQNVKAVPDLIEVVKDSNVLLFVLPHSFLRGILRQLKGVVNPNTICVSFIKGVQVTPSGELKRYSEIIKDELGVNHVAAVMGANLATDIARRFIFILWTLCFTVLRR